MPESGFRDEAPRSQPLAAVPGERRLVDEPSDATTDGFANCEIIPDRVIDCRRRQWLRVNESNPRLPDLPSALAEMQRLREENVRLRCLLQEHGIQSGGAVQHRDSRHNERTAKWSYSCLES